MSTKFTKGVSGTDDNGTRLIPVEQLHSVKKLKLIFDISRKLPVDSYFTVLHRPL